MQIQWNSATKSRNEKEKNRESSAINDQFILCLLLQNEPHKSGKQENFMRCYFLKMSINLSLSQKLKRILQIMAIGVLLIYTTIFLYHNIYGYSHSLQVKFTFLHFYY